MISFAFRPALALLPHFLGFAVHIENGISFTRESTASLLLPSAQKKHRALMRWTFLNLHESFLQFGSLKIFSSLLPNRCWRFFWLIQRSRLDSQTSNKARTGSLLLLLLSVNQKKEFPAKFSVFTRKIVFLENVN